MKLKFISLLTGPYVFRLPYPVFFIGYPHIRLGQGRLRFRRNLQRLIGRHLRLDRGALSDRGAPASFRPCSFRRSSHPPIFFFIFFPFLFFTVPKGQSFGVG